MQLSPEAMSRRRTQITSWTRSSCRKNSSINQRLPENLEGTGRQFAAEKVFRRGNSAHLAEDPNYDHRLESISCYRSKPLSPLTRACISATLCELQNGSADESTSRVAAHCGGRCWCGRRLFRWHVRPRGRADCLRWTKAFRRRTEFERSCSG